MPVRAVKLAAAVIFVALCACGKEDIPSEPTLVVDRTAVAFGGEFGEAVYVGTSRQESLMIQNKGSQDLVISSVDFTGDSQFAMELPEKLTVEYGERTFLRFLFTPKAVRSYNALVTIHSNAANAPDQLVELKGVGVDPNAGADGGM